MSVSRIVDWVIKTKIALISLVAVLALTGCVSPAAKRFQAHVDYLASDELGGRGVGSQGIELASQYIACQFADIGLEPIGDNDSYFQSLEITLHRTLTDDSRLSFTGDTTPRKQGRDFIPFNFSSNAKFSGPTVFCGYGIVAQDRDRNDYVHIDVSGKVVLMFRGEPASWADDNGYPTRLASFSEKIYNAKDRGASAVLIVNQAPANGENDKLAKFVSQGSDAYGIPAMHITRKMASAMLTAGGLGSLTKLQDRLDAGAYASASLAGIEVSGRAAFEKRTAPTKNVVGLLPGSGGLTDEYIIIGAHYDHLGIQAPMMRKFKNGKIVADSNKPVIHNGADDNASGVAGIIEIARDLATSHPKRGSRRSVLFIAFSAEESGLLGSNYYIKHPIVPLDKTLAMLNLDMIGRMKPGTHSVEVFGVKTAKEFDKLLSVANQSTHLAIAPTPAAGGRSDHAPFVRSKIPAMHFFTGQHSDYHKPTDDSYKIDPKGGELVSRLVAQTAKLLCYQTDGLTFDAESAKEKISPGGTPTYKVVMGLAPGYGDDGKRGMRVDAVNPEGPADLAGMKTGDRIVSIAGKPVANIYDYMASTRNSKPGDTVKVELLRGDKEMTINVELSAAK